jgi:hypothetical protein
MLVAHPPSSRASFFLFYTQMSVGQKKSYKRVFS